MTAALQKRLHDVRALILKTAMSTRGVGEIEESLKWGQSSFTAVRPKSGTTIRIAGKDDHYSLFVPCQTSVINDFRNLHPDMFSYHGTREIRLPLSAPMPVPELTLFISAALTYYLKPIT